MAIRFFFSLKVSCSIQFFNTMRSTFTPLYLWVAFLAGGAYANSRNACPKHPQEAFRVGKAVYLQSNKEHNSIISIPIGQDGKLYGGMITTTGGMGGDGIDGATNKPAGPDALSSQGSVAVSENASFKTSHGALSREKPANWSLIVSFRRERRFKHRQHVQN